MRKRTLEELQRLSIEAFRQAGKTPLVVVLDNLRSALNVGSIFRTADAFRLERVVLCGYTATPPNRDILKTALGATESVSWEYVEHALDAVTQLREQGYALWAVEQAEGSTSLWDFQMAPGQKYALVFGNEVSGVSDAVMAQADGAIEIPQFGTKHSINVAVCAGIVLWELFSQSANGKNADTNPVR